MNELKGLTYKVISLGCKVNYYETEAISQLLSSKGLIRVSDQKKSDISLINTCTVTEEGSRKSKKLIRRVISMNPNGISVAFGCLAQIDKTLKDIPGLNIVLGSTNKEEVYNKLLEYINNKEDICEIDDNIFHSKYDNLLVDSFKEHTRAFLKVQDGCTNFCSYCIIPYARGNSRSKELKDVIKEAKTLVLNGHKEIVVTGIDTGSYGKDIGTSLVDLLKELEKIEGLDRIRISSIEAKQITDEFIDLLKNSKKIVKHLHIPLQSGSNRILKLMNRHYDKEYFIETIDKIRKEINNISITTDFIVGFPTETIDDFNESLETLKNINFQKIHTFKYSIRKGTKAEALPQVDEKIKKERSKIVLKLSDDNSLSYIQNNLFKELDVIFEIYKDGYLYGHTGNYIYVKAKGNKEYLNKLINVKLLNIEKDAVLSQIL